jgi:hypothetical protein
MTGPYRPPEGGDQPDTPPHWVQNQPATAYPPVYPHPGAGLPGGPGIDPRRGFAGKIWPKIAAVLGVLVAVATFALVRAGLDGWLGSGDGRDRANPAASRSGPASPTGPPPGDAFAGTPAAQYPQGAAGIALPKATATGVFTAKQVTGALAGVKKAMIASRLDNQMLVRHNPEPFLGLVAADDKTLLRKDFAANNFKAFATQFAPGVTPAKEAPRVKGKITYRSITTGQGLPALEITTNFVWVYPFQVSTSQPGDDLVVVREELVWHYLQPKVTKSSRGLWLFNGQSYASNIDCAQYEKGFVAPGKRGLQNGLRSEDQDTVFDPDASLDLKTTC